MYTGVLRVKAVNVGHVGLPQNKNHFISIVVKPLRRTAGTHHIYRTSVGTQARTTSHKQQGLAQT